MAPPLHHPPHLQGFRLGQCRWRPLGAPHRSHDGAVHEELNAGLYIQDEGVLGAVAGVKGAAGGAAESFGACRCMRRGRGGGKGPQQLPESDLHFRWVRGSWPGSADGLSHANLLQLCFSFWDVSMCVWKESYCVSTIYSADQAETCWYRRLARKWGLRCQRIMPRGDEGGDIASLASTLTPGKQPSVLTGGRA